MTLKDLVEAVKAYAQKDAGKNSGSNKYLIICGCVICVLLYWFLCRDNGQGISLLGKQLDYVGNQQSEITSGLDNAKSTIGDAERATDNLQTEITESGALIKDCQRIIREVRERDEKRKQAIKDAT